MAVNGRGDFCDPETQTCDRAPSGGSSPHLDERSALDLWGLHERGARFLLGRRVPAACLDDAVNRVRAAVIPALMQGAIGSGELAAFIRCNLDRAVTTLGKGGITLLQTPPSVTPAPRLLTGLLREFTPVELRALKGFYLEGQTSAQICAALGLEPARFAALRQSARQRVLPLCQSSPPADRTA